MNSKDRWTKGPWKVTERFKGDCGEMYSRVNACSDISLEGTICEVWDGEHDDIANAKLIAKAPNMWRLLQDIHEAIGDGSINGVSNGEFNSDRYLTKIQAIVKEVLE